MKMDNQDVVAIYGLRSIDARLYHMSLWEFVQWWKPVRIKHPSLFYSYTEWLKDSDTERADAGVGYKIRPRMFEHKDIFVYPLRTNSGERYERFRNTWFLRRRLKPHVPCPENTPMPNGK